MPQRALPMPGRKHPGAKKMKRPSLYDRNAWRRARKHWLATHPLCAECKRQGRITAATTVDHIKPHRGNLQLFWDPENWQALCDECHGKKSAADRWQVSGWRPAHGPRGGRRRR